MSHQGNYRCLSGLTECQTGFLGADSVVTKINVLAGGTGGKRRVQETRKRLCGRSQREAQQLCDTGATLEATVTDSFPGGFGGAEAGSPAGDMEEQRCWRTPLVSPSLTGYSVSDFSPRGTSKNRGSHQLLLTVVP